MTADAIPGPGGERGRGAAQLGGSARRCGPAGGAARRLGPAMWPGGRRGSAARFGDVARLGGAAQ
ncbi:hypothetical protein, partial [Amycolatopsis kentuckyensis]|uniref:hypothetical protein n=1 Tax=Amycolatopsis kentuckyensis TaxID=218823 RepID=UPI001ABEEC58